MMDDKKKMVPRIRFRGFGDAWEQRKLSDISRITTGKPFNSVDFSSDGKYNVITNKNVRDFQHKRQFLGDRIDIWDDSVIQKYALFGDNILVTMDGVNIGIVGFYSGDNAVLAQRVGRIRSKQLLFVYQVVANDKFRIEMIKESVGNAIKHISLKQIQEYKSVVPLDLGEQSKIGLVFNKLDNLIVANEKKGQQLKGLKKLLMEKIFSQAWRLKEFSDPWEQRKLGEYYSFKNGINKEKKFFGRGVPIVNYTDVFHNRSLHSRSILGKVQATDSEQHRFSVKTGDIFFTRTSETIEEIGYSSVVLECSRHTVFSGFLIRSRAVTLDPLNDLFKKYVFFSPSFRKEMKRKSSMTTRALTSGTSLSEMYISFPKSLDEQRAIGLAITRLDNLIVANEKKLDQLKQLKKYLMQNMFV